MKGKDTGIDAVIKLKNGTIGYYRIFSDSTTTLRDFILYQFTDDAKNVGFVLRDKTKEPQSYFFKFNNEHSGKAEFYAGNIQEGYIWITRHGGTKDLSYCTIRLKEI